MNESRCMVCNWLLNSDGACPVCEQVNNINRLFAIEKAMRKFRWVSDWEAKQAPDGEITNSTIDDFLGRK